MSIPKNLQKAYAFFRDNAGTGAASSLNLARAEQWAVDNGYTFSWQWDDDPDLSWADEETRKLIREVLVCDMIVGDDPGKTVASLCGIVDPSRAYVRVVEAELASNVMYEVEQAAAEDRRAPQYLAL